MYEAPTKVNKQVAASTKLKENLLALAVMYVYNVLYSNNTKKLILTGGARHTVRGNKQVSKAKVWYSISQEAPAVCHASDDGAEEGTQREQAKAQLRLST